MAGFAFPIDSQMPDPPSKNLDLLNSLRRHNLISKQKLHGPSMFAVKVKIYGVLYQQSSSIAFDETSNYWSALKSS